MTYTALLNRLIVANSDSGEQALPNNCQLVPSRPSHWGQTSFLSSEETFVMEAVEVNSLACTHACPLKQNVHMVNYLGSAQVLQLGCL